MSKHIDYREWFRTIISESSWSGNEDQEITRLKERMLERPDLPGLRELRADAALTAATAQAAVSELDALIATMAKEEN